MAAQRREGGVMCYITLSNVKYFEVGFGRPVLESHRVQILS